MSQGGPHDIPNEVLDRFAASLATSDERAQVLQHVVRGCRSCIEYLRLARWEPTAKSAPGAYDGAFDNAGTDARKAFATRHLKVKPLLAALDALPVERRFLKARNLGRFASLEVAAALSDRAYAARFRDHRAMLLDARLAAEVAGAAARRRLGPPALLADVQARAWCEVGNALRVHGQLAEAKRAFTTANDFLEEGTGDPDLHALYSSHLGALCYYRREFAESRRALEKAAAIYNKLGNQQGAATALMRLAITQLYASDPAPAREALLRALELLTRPDDGSLRRAALHNLGRCYLELGAPYDAHGLWVKTSPLYEHCEDELLLLRREWQRGEIDRDLGLFNTAEFYLARVREEYLARDLAYDAAVVSLDLAEVYALQRKAADVVRTIGETIPIFGALGVTRELLAALMKIAEVARESDAVLRLLRQAQAELKLLGVSQAGSH